MACRKCIIWINPLQSSHYNDVIISAMASQITSCTIVYSTSYQGADQRKHQSFASLAFVRGIHWSPVNSPHNGPVTRKMFPFDDVIMIWAKADLSSLWPSTIQQLKFTNINCEKNVKPQNGGVGGGGGSGGGCGCGGGGSSCLGLSELILIMRCYDTKCRGKASKGQRINIQHMVNIHQSVKISRGRHKMETFFSLLGLCAGNSPVIGEFPTQRPVTRGAVVFFDLRPNKRFSKQL